MDKDIMSALIALLLYAVGMGLSVVYDGGIEQRINSNRLSVRSGRKTNRD